MAGTSNSDFVTDTVSGEIITAQHAVLIPNLNDVPDIIEYVKAVGSIVGANQIRSAYQKDGKVKIYLRFRKDVDVVVSTGVRLRGRHTDVEYAIIPATKVSLSDVESELCNSVIERKLSSYGKIVSKISTLKLGMYEPEYSHIETNSRQIFMQIKPGVVLPKTLEFNYNGTKYEILVTVEEENSLCINDCVVENEDNPSRTFKPSRMHTRSHTEGNRFQTEESENSASYQNAYEKALPQLTKSRGRGRGRSYFRSKGKRRGGWRGRSLGSSVLTARSIKNSIIKRGRGYAGRRFRGRGRGGRGSNKINSKPTVTLSDVGHISDSEMYEHAVESELPFPENKQPSMKGDNPMIVAVKTDIDGFKYIYEHGQTEHSNDIHLKLHYDQSDTITASLASINNIGKGEVSQYPLTAQKLELFLKMVKNSRNPMEIALNVLETNRTPGALADLCNQLLEYYNTVTDDHPLKSRVSRLIFILSEGKKNIQ